MKKLITILSLACFLSPLIVSAALYKSSDGKVWADWNGKRRWIRTLEIFNSYGYQWSDVKDIADLSLSIKPINNLVRIKDKPEVYALSDSGYKRHIHNPDIFNSYNLSWDDVADINEAELAGYSDCNLIKEADNEKVYKLDGSTLYPIKDLATFNYYEFSWSALQIINSEDLATYTIGSELAYTAGAPSPSPVWSPTPSPSSTPSPSPTPTPTPTPSPSSSPISTPTPSSNSLPLRITVEKTTIGLTTASLEWSTNMPTDSKLFLTKEGSNTQVFPSISGNSTKHIAYVSNLISGTQYAYSIEAIAGTQVEQKEDSFTTPQQSFTPQTIENLERVPYLLLYSDRPFTIKKLVVLNDNTYCANGIYDFVVLNASYQSGNSSGGFLYNMPEKDSTNRFTFDYLESGAYLTIGDITFNTSGLHISGSDVTLRFSGGHSGSGTSCLYDGSKYTLLGSESIIIGENGQQINLQDVILVYTR